MRKVIIESKLSLGDIVMLSSAIRDLYIAHPGKFLIDVRTPFPLLWTNNPYITRLKDSDPEVERIKAHYPLINKSRTTPYHFIHGYRKNLEEQLKIVIPPTEFKGDIHLSDKEKSSPRFVDQFGIKGEYWLIQAGGKLQSWSSKLWHPDYWQEVVNHFKGKITFVQCGVNKPFHLHPKLDNVVDLIGKERHLRDYINLIYHSLGTLSIVTGIHHLNKAIPQKFNHHRALVTIASGVEPTCWEQYNGQIYLTKSGTMPCCSGKGGCCWKTRSSKIVGEKYIEDKSCQVNEEVKIPAGYEDQIEKLLIPKCLTSIKPNDVIRAIESYYESGLFNYNNVHADNICV